MPARRPRKTQGKCVLFADAAKLYIGYSKAVTSAETAVKRMRFFAQFYNAAFAERDIASISPYVPPATARARPPQKQDTCRTTRSCLTTVTYFYGYSIIDYSVFTYSHFRQII